MSHMNTISHTTTVARRRQSGFSLLEVLIALLVLSIGLLGLAALQTMGLKFNTQSYQRTQAVLQAYDIIDRMRANPIGMAAGLYNNVGINDSAPTLPTCPCSSTQMANYDLNQWKNAIGALLAQGKGAVCRGTLDGTLANCTDAGTGTTFTVGIEWMENDLPMRMQVMAQL
jgi:type IV pilus assembly protein PilV